MGRTKTCSIDGCNKLEQLRQDMCHMHYERWRLKGDPLVRNYKQPGNEVERFLSKVQFADENECWEWLGSRTYNGYGRFPLNGGKKTVRAHRYMFELVIGPILDGLEIDHVKKKGCMFRHCVNPTHLEPVTRKENAQRIYT